MMLIAVVLVLLIGTGYLVYTTTPFYAFQEALSAAKDHDLAKFRGRVDVQGFVECLLNDLLVQPAESTPRLSSVQREACHGAVILAKATMEQEIISAIERAVGGDAATRNTSWFFWEQSVLAQGRGNDIGKLLEVTTTAVSGSVGQMSRDVFTRMQKYAESHRDTTPGRLLATRSMPHSTSMERMIEQFGLVPSNLKGIGSYKTDSDSLGEERCQIAFIFFSPKVNHNVQITVELTKGSMFSVWQIRRLVDLQEFFLQFGENYNDEIHAMMISSLEGISDQSVKDQMRGITDKIKQNPSTRGILDRLNIR